MDNIPSNTLLAWTLDANKALNAVVPESSKEVSVFKKVLQSILKHEKLPAIDDKFKESITEIQDLVAPVKKENQSDEEFEREIFVFRSLYGVETEEQLDGFQK